MLDCTVKPVDPVVSLLEYVVTASLLLIVCTVLAAKLETTPAAAMVIPEKLSSVGLKLITMAGVNVFSMTLFVSPWIISQ